MHLLLHDLLGILRAAVQAMAFGDWGSSGSSKDDTLCRTCRCLWCYTVLHVISEAYLLAVHFRAHSPKVFGHRRVACLAVSFATALVFALTLVWLFPFASSFVSLCRFQSLYLILHLLDLLRCGNVSLLVVLGLIGWSVPCCRDGVRKE